LDAPQGYLSINRGTGIYNFNEKVRVVIRKSGQMQTLHVLPLNTVEKLIVGEYDLEILCLPRVYLNKIKINQSASKVLPLEDAGMLRLQFAEAGSGCIMQEIDGDLKWVCNIAEVSGQQVFYLQPGKYRAEWRAASLKQSIYTIEKRFAVESNKLIHVNF
jgi:Ca-activated chloride channel family protein